MEPAPGRNVRFLAMAAGVALESKCRFRHGAVVVKNGRVLGSAPNLLKNDPRYVDFHHSSIHAEVAALRRARFPRRATVFIARINKVGALRYSKPCPSCQELIDGLQCRVVYTESEGVG